ncbi:MAG: hypothetical protein WCA38_18915 [Candidatus Acidiferrales bacterium]
MLIKKKPELTYADVTPKGLHMGRRNFLFGRAATYGAVVGYKKLTRMTSALSHCPTDAGRRLPSSSATLRLMTPLAAQS